MDIEGLVKRRARAVGTMQMWRSTLDKAYRYAAPNKNQWRDNAGHGTPIDKGANLTGEIYDLTLLIGTRTFVNRLVNSLIPQNQQWLRFIPGEEIDEDTKDEAARELQKLTDKFFFYLDNSSFYLATPEAFEDMAISTGVLQINEGDDEEPLVFSSVPANAISFEAGVDGSFKGYFRDFVDIPVPEVKSYWPDATIPSKYEYDKDDGKMHVVEATLYNYKTKQWDTTIFELGCKEVMQKYSEEEPAFCGFRWNRRSGEIMGRGPALDATPSAASINEAMRDELIAAAFKANPMYMAYTENVVNLDNFRVRPGAIVPVLPSAAGSWPLTPVPTAGDVNFGILVVQDLRAQIEKLMFSSPLGNVNLPKQTATEAQIRLQELNENAAASFSRIKREFFDQLVKRCLYILRKRGLWPDIKINGKIVAIKYETPLSTSRGQAEAQKLVAFHQALTGMVGPELAAAAMNLAKLPFFLADNLEVDLELVKSEQDIENELAQAKEALEAQAEQEGVEVANTGRERSPAGALA